MNKFAMGAIAATAALMSLPAYAQAPATAPGASMTLQQNQVTNLWRASKLDGVNVYNNNNEKIGEIGDVLIDKMGKAMAVVVDVGGFLGMGEHRVALKFEDVKFSDTPMSNSTARTTGTMNSATTTTTTTTAPAGAPPSSTVSTAANSNANSTMANMYPDHAILNMTKDQLKALPQISYSR
ncbi:MAG: photosystem reaction center subunit [Hyphomicrobiales bacterium]|nr:photosystem reaction center subunit [Hyphomicrobiales bacterium]